MTAMGTVLLCLSPKQCDKESGIWSILSPKQCDKESGIWSIL